MQHVRPTLRWIVCLALCIGLVGCVSLGMDGIDFEATEMPLVHITQTLPIPDATIVAHKTPQPITGSDFTKAWLEGKPCAPPCWQDITPHETTLAEAIETLNQLSFIVDIEPYDNETLDFSLVVGNERYGGSLIYQKEPPYIIDQIHLSLPTITLGEVIAAYGKPSNVLVSTQADSRSDEPIFEGRTYWLAVVYPELGFVAGGRGSDLVENQELDGLKIFGKPFALPLDQRMKSIFGRMTNSYELVPWQGYQSFIFYCAQVPRNVDPVRSPYTDCPDFGRKLLPKSP